MASSVAKLFVQIDANAAGFTKAIGGVDKTIAGVGKKLENIGAGLTKAGKSLTSALTLPIVAGAALATKAAIDWESAWAGVLKTMDATPDQLQTIHDGIRDMALQIPVAATELAGLAEIGGQLGIGPDSILGFVRTIADLAASTNIQGPEGAAQLAQFANILSEKEFDRIGSAITALGNNSATSEQQILNLAMRLAGAGAVTGMATSDVLGLAAAMASLGINAELGGTAMSKVLSDMAKTVAGGASGGSVIDNTDDIAKQQDKLTKLRQQLELVTMRQSEFTKKTKESTRQTAKFQIDNLTAQIAGLEASLSDLQSTNGGVEEATGKLEDFARVAGVSSAEFADIFKKDATKALTLFLKGLEKIRAEGGDVYGVLDSLKLGAARTRDTLIALTGDTELLEGAIALGAQAWKENNALTEEAARRYGTTASKLALLKNRFEEVMMQIGGPLVEALTRALEAAEPFFKIIENAAKSFANADPSQQGLILFLGALATAIGPVALVLGGVVTGIGTLIGFAATPVGLGITGLLAALAAYTIEDFGGLSEVVRLVSAIGSEIAAGPQTPMQRFKGFEADFMDQRTNTDQVKQWDANSYITSLRFGEDWRNSAEGVDYFIKSMNGYVTEGESSMEQLTGKIDSLRESLDSLKETLAGPMEELNKLRDAFGAFFGSPFIQNLIDLTGTFITTMFRATFNTVLGLLKFFTGLFTGDWELFAEGAKLIFGGFRDYVLSAIDFIVEGLARITGWVVPDWLSKILPSTREPAGVSAPTGISPQSFTSGARSFPSGGGAVVNNLNSPIVGTITVNSQADKDDLMKRISAELEAAFGLSVDAGTRAGMAAY